MNIPYRILALFIGVIMVFGACNHGGKKTADENMDSVSLEDIKPLERKYDTLKEGMPIFYNMYLSVDMSTLFHTSGAVFKAELLNSPDRMPEYSTSSKKALNLGVFAVDLSYAKVSEQVETAGRYFVAMQKMAEEMGIPSEYFKNTSERFDRNIDNKDSLIKIANEVYMASDNYLRENERYAASAQIILGGWIEAIYLADNVAIATRDIDVIERLAEQRISLANVVSMLSEYTKDQDINQNLKALKELQPVFNSFVVKVDSHFNPSSPEGKKVIQGYVDKISEIDKHIRRIRNGIIS
jgi:hypothetical protein